MAEGALIDACSDRERCPIFSDAFAPLASLKKLSLLNNFKMFQFVYSLLPPSLSLAGLELTSLDLSANLISAVPFDLIQEVNASLTHLFMGGNVFVELGYMTTSK